MFSARHKRDRGPASFQGAGLLFFLILSTVPAGCGDSADPAPDPEVEEAKALGLGVGARLHRVILGGRGSEEHVLPAKVRAEPGDGVAFVTVDHRVHTLSFPRDSLSPGIRAFLTSTGQESVPPLLYRGNRFILRLTDAPLGRIPFLSQGHGGIAHGVIEVGIPSDSLVPGAS